LVPLRTSGAAGNLFWVCLNCRDGHRGYERIGYQCENNGYFYSMAHVPMVELDNGQIWSDVSFRSHGFTCAATGGRYSRDYRVVMFNGQAWHTHYFRDHGFACRYSGDRFPRTMALSLSGDTPDHRNAIGNIHAHHTFKCECCGKPELLAYKQNRYGGNWCRPCVLKQRDNDYRLMMAAQYGEFRKGGFKYEDTDYLYRELKQEDDATERSASA
jgi:hypothetical protein